MKEIAFKNKKYKIKYTLRALFIFEQITGKSFKIENLLDNYILYYSLLIANNPNDVLDWNDFIDELDENPQLIQEFAEVITNQEKKDQIFEVEDGESKKKD